MDQSCIGRSTHRWDDWPLEGLVSAKRDHRFRLVVAARNETAAVGDIVGRLRDALLDRVGLLDAPSVSLVEGCYVRPFTGLDPRPAYDGGRVTELGARPLIALHFPKLSGLGVHAAARRTCQHGARSVAPRQYDASGGRLAASARDVAVRTRPPAGPQLPGAVT